MSFACDPLPRSLKVLLISLALLIASPFPRSPQAYSISDGLGPLDLIATSIDAPALVRSKHVREPQVDERPQLTLIAVSPDGGGFLAHASDSELLWYVDSASGQARQISSIPHTGYFSSLSPNGRYVCYKHFEHSSAGWLSFPALYDLALDVVVPLALPARQSGNPTMSKSGLAALTTGARLIVLDSQGKQLLDTELGFVANHMAFSSDDQLIALTDEDENLWILNRFDPAHPILLAKEVGFGPSFSPDDRLVAVQSARGDVSVIERLTARVIPVGRGIRPQWFATNALMFQHLSDETEVAETKELLRRS
jgi:hypothetical protein